MKALVYRGPGSKGIEERPKPELKAPDDAIVKIAKTTICGTDLHILKGDVPRPWPSAVDLARRTFACVRSALPQRVGLLDWLAALRALAPFASVRLPRLRVASGTLGEACAGGADALYGADARWHRAARSV
jgi:hypothetical protein